MEKIKIWLYNEGNEYIDATGGWIGKQFNATYTSGYYTKYDDYLEYGELQTGSGAGAYGVGGFITTNNIDLSLFNNLSFKHELVSANHPATSGAPSLHCGISTTSTPSSGFIKLHTLNTRTNQVEVVEEVDLSSYNEYYHLGVSAEYMNVSGSTVKAKLYYMYLETTLDKIISIENYNETNLSFTSNPLNNMITITQIDIISKDVFAQETILKTYTENFESISYDIEYEKIHTGDNHIFIRLQYNQSGYHQDTVDYLFDMVVNKEVVLDVFEPLSNLDNPVTLNQFSNRINEIYQYNKININNLSMILDSQGIMIDENPKMSELIELTKLITANSDVVEINNYKQHIKMLQEDIDELNIDKEEMRLLLYSIMDKKRMNVNEKNTFDELITILNNSSTVTVSSIESGDQYIIYKDTGSYEPPQPALTVMNEYEYDFVEGDVIVSMNMSVRGFTVSEGDYITFKTYGMIEHVREGEVINTKSGSVSETYNRWTSSVLSLELTDVKKGDKILFYGRKYSGNEGYNKVSDFKITCNLNLGV